MNHSSELQAHGQRIVARSKVCEVQCCGCGMIHVLIGSITLHLTPNAFKSVSDTMGNAVRRLTKTDEQPPEFLC